MRPTCLRLLAALIILVVGINPIRAADRPLFDYRQITLDNGLRVITLEDASCPIVAVHLWYHVGSKDERPERQGFAHMFEHMMFRGTDRLGRTDHFDLIRRTGGECNAYTSFDQTVYVQTVPANQLELVLWLEAERMGFLRIDQTSFDTERKVVEEERRLGLNQPYGTVPEKLVAEMFRTHPYGWTPIGKISHLRASAAQELRDFWNRYYVPNNATLVIVGDIRHAEAQRLARRYFGWMPREAEPPRVTVREPMPTKARAITLREDNAPATVVGIAWRTVPSRHDDAIPLELLGTILGGGDSSRLHRRLVAETQVAVVALAGSFSLEQEGFFGGGAVLAPFGADSKKVLAELREQIERLRNEPVSERELLKARNQLLSRQVVQNLTVASKATQLGTAAVLEGNTARVNRRLEQIRRVTAEDLRRVARLYLAPERSLTVTVERNLFGSMLGRSPAIKREEEAPITAKPETTPPPPGRPGLRRPGDFPEKPPAAKPLATRLVYAHSRHTLSNGMKVLVVPNRKGPYVDIQLGLRAGAWTEKKPGTASLALGMLTKGSAKHTERELAEELDTYAINLGGAGGMDASSVSAGCLTEHVERAVTLLAEVVQSPTFPEDEFVKLRKRERTALTLSSAQPAYLADREFRRRLFGSHPYARTESGEIEDLDALIVGDLRTWWTTFARPDQAVLIFSGDIDAERALPLAEAAFGKWKATGPKPETVLPPLPTPAARHIYLVDNRGVQSQIRIGGLGITRGNPDYPTAHVVSDYFGGAFGARLNETIRVKKGLTYGARGGFGASRFAGRFTASTFSKTESTAEAVKAVLAEIDRLRREPPTARELEDTRAYVVGSFARERETPRQVAQDLWLIESEGLPGDYFERLLDRVGRVDTDACMRLVQKAIDPEKLVIVVVGDAERVRKDLEQIAPVTVVKRGGTGQATPGKPKE